jgi:CheY-like chemotaxis protein
MQQIRQSGEGIAHKKVLIVDDDVRNIFALTSMLERWDMDVLSAENGRQALDILRTSPEVDLVLMDIMMPEMDGYQTTRAIRDLPRFRELPIIALTAKAMKDDRRKCLDAGASDYVAKPVQGEQLRSLLRVWLDRP